VPPALPRLLGLADLAARAVRPLPVHHGLLLELDVGVQVPLQGPQVLLLRADIPALENQFSVRHRK
jgi:hypothetical protein